jgi:restriction endonuclease Mrr
MHAVIRTYSGRGAKELFDVLEQRKADVESVMRPIKGFVSYTAARTGDGGITVTVCQDKAGADESVARARDWVAKNAASIGAAAPTVSEGSVIIHAK